MISTGEKDFDVIALGEVMMRLSPPDSQRIAQSNVFEKNAGGSELNVVSGISLLGLRTALFTKLPTSNLGYFIKNEIRSNGVSDDYIVYDDNKHSRLGIYYYESGAYPRKPSVIYDRHNSSMYSISMDEVPDSIFASCRVFHVSGITLALSENTHDTTIQMMKKFKQNGAQVSFDVNFRANLWTEQQARETIEKILKYVDLLFISEETFRKMFGMTGQLQDLMKEFSDKYNIALVATSRRTVISPMLHSFDSVVYDARNDQYYSEPPYERVQVVDRIGSGDAFVAGVLFAYLRYGASPKCVEYGNAMAAVKNTVQGDLLSSSLDEIESIIATHKGHGNDSEMNR